MPQVKRYMLLLFCGLKDLTLGKPFHLRFLISEFSLPAAGKQNPLRFCCPFFALEWTKGFSWIRGICNVSLSYAKCVHGLVICSFRPPDTAEGEPWFPSQAPREQWLLFCIASGSVICCQLLPTVSPGVIAGAFLHSGMLKFLVTWILLWKLTKEIQNLQTSTL